MGCGGNAKTAPQAVHPGAKAPWKCHVVDPEEPTREQGNVTHTKQRLLGDTLEYASVFHQYGEYGVQRLSFRRSGDVFTTSLAGVPVVATLGEKDGSRWSLRYEDPGNGITFEESMALDADGILSVTSKDPRPDGITTVRRYLPASCETVDRELAKYPGSTDSAAP